MRALIVLVVAGFPVSLLMAWYLELGPGGITVDRLPDSAARPRVRGARRYSDVIVIAVLLGIIVVLLARQGGLLQEPAGTPVIGVLPFTEQGGPEDGYFGAGLADTLAYKLGQLRQVLVLAPSSTREFTGPGQDLAKIGALLGATALLEGTVRRAAGNTRVNARLVDITSSRQLWSGSFDRTGADLFAMQDEIATDVTEALQLILSPEEKDRITHTLTSSLTAYDAYLLGRARLATRDREKMSESVDYFRQAVRIDPDYALAHAALAEAIFLSTTYSIAAPSWDTARVEAQAAAARAQALDPAGGDGYLAQAFVAMGDNEFGDGSAWPRDYIATLLQKAVEYSPNSVSALKFYSSYVDSKTEAVALLQRAAQLDPRSGIIQMNLGDQLAKAGDMDGAMDRYLNAIGVTGGEFALTQMALPFILQYTMGKVDEAARWARVLNRTYPNRDNATGLLRALLGLGAWEEAKAAVDQPPTKMDANDPILLRQRIVLSLARNDCLDVDAAVLALEHKLTELGGAKIVDVPPAMILEPARTAQGLCLVRNGQRDEALQLLQNAVSELAFLPFPNIAAVALRTQILLAALYKSQGLQDQARQLLDKLLEAAEGVPANELEGASFSRFMALAVRGEQQAALAELQMVAELGWTEDWWLLDALAFDPDYAAVQAEPRYKEIRAQLEERVRQMRESYLANPQPSAEQLLKAGLNPEDLRTAMPRGEL